MKALIFNSGLGSRLGELTASSPKAMVKLGNGESVFERQLRILNSCGITEFVVTTGPYAEQIERAALPFIERGCEIVFVENPKYRETNYIYSMYCARDHLRDDDVLMIHGDLVFDIAYVQEVLDSELPSLGSVNSSIALPEKDFKARVSKGHVLEVSVNIFDEDCVAFQPFYKLNRAAMDTWLAAVERYVEEGNTGVYAENAANEVFAAMGIAAFSYEGHYVDEVDTPEDLQRVSAAIRLYDFAEQPVFVGDGGGSFEIGLGSNAGGMRDVRDAATLLSALFSERPLVVASQRFEGSYVARSFREAGIEYCLFSDFTPNPTFDEVAAGTEMFRARKCDGLVSFGGGSAIDIAKCIKALSAFPEGAGADKLSTPMYNRCPHIAIPTTAGTGSEATHFAVCYIGGKKTSVTHDCLMPDAVVLDSSFLAGLPIIHRSSAALDALSQAIESHWSRRSSTESRRYSAEAMSVFARELDGYLRMDSTVNAEIMRAAHLAGKAINLTTTTAAHAMSYGLTARYGIPHGHAVALCLPHVWRALAAGCDAEEASRLQEIATCLGEDTPDAALERYLSFVDASGLGWQIDNARPEDAKALASDVNTQRLNNFPLVLTGEEIEEFYRAILAGSPERASL